MTNQAEENDSTADCTATRIVLVDFEKAKLMRAVVDPVLAEPPFAPCRPGSEDVWLGQCISHRLRVVVRRGCDQHNAECWKGIGWRKRPLWDYKLHPGIQANMKKSADAAAALRAAGWTDEGEIAHALEIHGGLPPRT